MRYDYVHLTPKSFSMSFKHLILSILLLSTHMLYGNTHINNLQIESTKVVDIGTNTACVSWLLGDYTTGQVEYGETTSYGSFNAKETSFKYKSHRQVLKGLKPNTIYHYRVISEDKNGNRVGSEDKIFKTLAKKDTKIAQDSLINGFLLYPFTTETKDEEKKVAEAKFINKFSDALKTLKANGINTIFFVTSWQYFCTDIFSKKFYKDRNVTNTKGIKFFEIGRGHKVDFFQKLAKLTRDEGMKIVVFYNVLSHLRIDPIAKVHPEYMIKYAEWDKDVNYTKDAFVEHNGTQYISKYDGSLINIEPGKDKNFKYWSVCYRDLLNPLHLSVKREREKILSTVIEAFTVDRVLPDGVHIGGDEAISFSNLNCNSKDKPCGNHTYDSLFANEANKIYEYINREYPDMDVYMWGDMLGKNHNGPALKTEKAIEYLNKNIIIVDWKYRPSVDIGYNKRSHTFKSMKEFTDNGFKVLSAPWNNVEAAKALVWTGKMINLDKNSSDKSGNYIGNLNTVWSDKTFYNIIDELRKEQVNPPKYVKEVASVIRATNNSLHTYNCKDNGEWTGIYPHCYDCNTRDGDYNGEYRNYSKSMNGDACIYTVLKKPKSILSWDFNDKSDLLLGSGAKLIYDEKRAGNVLLVKSPKAYALSTKKYDKLAKIELSLSISMWFNMTKNIKPRTFQVLFSKGYTEYELTLYKNGLIGIYKSNPDINTSKPQYEVVSIHTTNKKPWEVDHWYHIVWSMKGKTHKIYLDGELYSNTSKYAGVVSKNHNIAIGKRIGSDNYNFNGKIDDIKIFDHVISEIEVKSLSGFKK